MSRFRTIALVATAAIMTAICVRLGVWQLDRLAERRAANARIAATIGNAPVDIATAIGDSLPTGQRVEVRGRYDFGSEIVLVNRSRDGAPGVNLLTPVRIAGRDTAVMVNRGWVYSPDGASVDQEAWREPEHISGTAYVLWPSVVAAGTSVATRPLTDRRLPRADPHAIAALMPFPVTRYTAVLLADSPDASASGDASPTTPARLPPPPLDEGPHKSYAIQWFSFAAVVLIGTGALVRSERTRARLRKNGRPRSSADVP